MHSLSFMLKKDVRLCRTIFVSTICLWFGIVLLSCLQVLWIFTDVQGAAKAGLMFGFWSNSASLVAFLMVPIVGGYIFANERVTHSIEFLDYIARGRPLIYVSKLVVVGCYWAIWVWLIAASDLAADLCVGDEYSSHVALISAGSRVSVFGSVLFMGLIGFATSSLIDSPGVSTVLALMSFMLINVFDQTVLEGFLSERPWILALALVSFASVVLFISFHCYCRRERP